MELPAELAPFRLLRLCRMQATSNITANISSKLAIATPIANFRIEMQNSSSDMACRLVKSSAERQI